MRLTSDEKKQHADLMRAAAEAELASHPVVNPAALQPKELLHELRVHQIELEMQNETLRQAQSALEESRDSYRNLYEFAPVGYLSLTREGLIEEINLTATRLLQRERKKLLQRSFTALVVAEDKPRWASLFMRLKASDANGRVELALQRGDGTLLQAQLDCERGQSARIGAGDTALLVVLQDISVRKGAEVRLAEQLDELRRWQAVMLDREDRNTELKREINGLLLRLGEPIRYASQAAGGSAAT